MEEKRLEGLLMALLLSRAGGEVIFEEEELEDMRSISNLRIESKINEDGSIRMRLLQGGEEDGYTYH